MNAKAVAWLAPQKRTAVFGANGAILDTFLFTADDADYEIVAASEVHDVAGDDAGSVTADVVVCASGTTVASGTSLLASTFDLKSTADTPVTKTYSGGGLATNRKVARGSSVAINFTGTLTTLAGVAITVTFVPLTRPVW